MRSIWIAILLAILIWSCNWTPDEFDIKNISTYKQLQIIRGLKSSFDLDGYDFKVVEYPNPDIANVSSDAAGHFELTGLAPGNTSMSIEYLVDSESESGLSSVIYVQVQVSNGIPVDIFVADTLDLDIRLYLNEATTLATDSMDVQYPGGASLVHSEVKLTPETFILKFIGLSPGDDSLVVNFYDVADTIILSLPFEIESSIKKIPLIEVFTNSGCINCPEANHYLDNIFY